MKAVKLFVFLVIMTFVRGNLKFLVSQSIKGFVQEYLSKKSLEIELVIYGKFGLNLELVDEILKDQSTAYKVLARFSSNSESKELGLPSIHIFDSLNTFEATKDVQWLGSFGELIEKLVYIPNATTNDIMIRSQNKYPMLAINFLINGTEESIDLVSFRVVTSGNCKCREFQKINQFNRKSMKYESEKFYLKEFLDIPNCTLLIVTDKINCFPTYCNILGTIADLLNYNIIYERWNRVSNQIKFDIQEPLETKKGFHRGTLLIYSEIVSTVPPGEPYTQLEKIFLMFDIEVWIAIVATLLIAIATVQVTKIWSIKVRNFVFGTNIKTPIVNLIATFLAGGQFKIPQRNFARFLLMLFIIWSLIIRTCYQSLLFTYLQSDMRKPIIKTKDELFKMNLTYYNTDEKFLRNYFGNETAR